METRFLETFLLIADTGSVAEAGRRLNITPSAVTQRIRALEAELGQPLLQRLGQRMEPTLAGGAIIAQARQMLVLADDMRSSGALKGDSGLLRIGVIQTALTGLLPEILVRIRHHRPGIDIHLIPGASSELYAKLNEGELDAAIIVKPQFTIFKAMDWLTLRREHMMFVAPSGLGDIDPMRLLRSQPFIRYDRNNWGGQVVDQYLRRKRIPLREQFELDSLEAIVIMVSRGLGVSVIPDWPEPWPEGARLDRAVLADAPMREIGILWSRASRRLPIVRSFLAEAAGVYPVPRQRPQEI